jgi:hypothetical protein
LSGATICSVKGEFKKLPGIVWVARALPVVPSFVAAILTNMKLEFISAQPQNPFLRLSDLTSSEACQLRQAFLSLAAGFKTEIRLHEAPGAEPVGHCRLTLRAAHTDEGILQTAPSGFEARFTESAWNDMAHRIAPCCKPGASGSQWLSQHGSIGLLLSQSAG